MICFSGAAAADYYVDYFYGSDTEPGTAWNRAKRTLLAAVETASANDTVHVTAGTYRDPISLKPGMLILGGYAPGGDTRNPGIYLSELNGMNIVQIMRGAESCELDGLIFRDGYAPAGGALIISSANMTVRNCRFEQNRACSDDPDGGGAVYIFNSSPVFLDCSFTENGIEPADPQPGLYLTGGAVMCWSASPVFIRCLFQRNTVPDGDGSYLSLGGAVFTINSTPHFVECRFHGNESLYGGALGWWNHSAATVAGCFFSSNIAGEGGGAIASMSACDWRESRIIDSVFECNQSNAGGAVAGLQETDLLLSGNLFIQNTAADRGGAVFGFHRSVIRIENSTLNGNILQGGSVRGGAGIYIGDDVQYHIVSNIITGGVFGEGIYLGDGDHAGSSVTHNCVFGNTRGNYGGSIPDQTGFNGNISSDPLFTGDATGDYHLSQISSGQNRDSPCVDTGTDSIGRRGSTRTDGGFDQDPADIGYHYRRTHCLIYLDRYYYRGGDSMNVVLLNAGNRAIAEGILYIALQIGESFWFVESNGGSFGFKDVAIPFDDRFVPSFDAPQNILSIPFPDDPLPRVYGIWHSALLDSGTLDLLDYRWTAFELYPG